MLHTLTGLGACEHCPGPGDELAGVAGALLWSLFNLGRLWFLLGGCEELKRGGREGWSAISEI